MAAGARCASIALAIFSLSARSSLTPVATC